MSKRRAVGLAILAGFGLGIATIQGLGAKDTAPVFLVAEVEVTDLEGYMKEYVPLVQKSLEASGGRVLAAGQNVTPIEGTPPKGRVVIMQWDSLDQIKAWHELGAIQGRPEDRRQIRDLPDLRCRGPEAIGLINAAAPPVPIPPISAARRHGAPVEIGAPAAI